MSLFRRTLLLSGLFLLLPRAPSAAAETGLRASSRAVRAEIQAVIDGQLAAFRAHDVARAYGHAGARVQASLSPAGFARLVARNYPEIWNNEKADYGVIRDNGERAELLVHVSAPGADAAFDYHLRREGGAWRIVGVLRHNVAADRV